MKLYQRYPMAHTRHTPMYKINRQPHASKILAIIILVAFLVSLASTSALAGEKKEPTTLSILKFATGLITAYAIHETGHALTASLTGTKVDWGIGTYNQPIGFKENADNDTAGALLHASGLTTQLLASEIVLQSDSIDKNDNFVRGMMAWNIVNPIVYTLDYWFIRRTNQECKNTYQGDLEGFEHYTNETSANVFGVTMAAMGAYHGLRFMRTQRWAPNWLKNDNINMTWKTRRDKGFELLVEIDF